jgi:hypothetical protein
LDGRLSIIHFPFLLWPFFFELAASFLAPAIRALDVVLNIDQTGNL